MLYVGGQQQEGETEGEAESGGKEEREGGMSPEHRTRDLSGPERQGDTREIYPPNLTHREVKAEQGSDEG